MTDVSDPRRDAIHAALQANGSYKVDEGALLTGWALVTEWMDTDGEKWLSRVHSATIPAWVAKGMWHEALNSDWPTDD